MVGGGGGGVTVLATLKGCTSCEVVLMQVLEVLLLVMLKGWEGGGYQKVFHPVLRGRGQYVSDLRFS